MNKKPTILIVDDDPKLRKTLTDILGVKGFDPISIAKGREALRRIKGSAPNVALIDLKLDDMDGLELIKEIKVLSPSTECIVITGNASQESAVEAVNLGAYSYILKPYDVEQLLITINRAIEKQQSEQRIHNQLRRLEALREIDQAISSSTNLKTILNVLIRRLIENLEVDAGAILLYRPVMQDLEYVTGFGFKAEAFKDIRVRLGEGQAGKAALERRIINIPDLAIESIKIERAKLIQQEKFVAYFGVPLIAKGDIVGVLEVFHRTPVDPSPEWFNFLDTLAGQAAIAINDGRLFENLQRSNIEILQAYDDTLEGWAMALEMRDKETEGHARRVVDLTMKMARAIGIHENELVHVRRGALLHDIGKMGIPDSILQKPGPLDENEWEIMREHPTYAYRWLSSIRYLRPALEIPRYHHEKWDGTGYPQGLKGEEIPLAARIFAIVDVWDALRFDRPYRDAWSQEKALAHIRQEAGSHFDPQVVEIFFAIVSEGESAD